MNPHASAWETTEGYGDKRNYVCALKNGECAAEGETLLQDQGKTFVDLHWKCLVCAQPSGIQKGRCGRPLCCSQREIYRSCL